MSSPDIVVRIDRKALTLVAAVILVAALGRLLWSEVLTLVTTYPAPSGIYNTITTTGDSGLAPANTTLNRNAGHTILVPPTNAGGNVGIGTTSPASKLDVAGDISAGGALKGTKGIFSSSVQLGNDNSACNPAKAGALRWGGASVEVCDGAAWKSVGAGMASPAESCAADKGAWVSGPNMCYFSGSSCPAGWSSTGYTSTQASTCNTRYPKCPGGGMMGNSCTTGSHNRQNKAAESCTWSDTHTRWQGKTLSCYPGPPNTCVASVTETSCSKNL